MKTATEVKLFEKVLKPEYYISTKNLKTIESNFEKFNSYALENDILKNLELENIFEQSIKEVDYNLNWKDKSINSKRWFLMYVLYPIHKATSYEEVLKIVYNQHSMDLTCRNSILLMFDLNYTGTYPKQVKKVESLDTIIKRKFKNLSNQALVSKINRASDFGWDDEGYEIERRVKASNGKLEVKMNGNRLEIIKQ